MPFSPPRSSVSRSQANEGIPRWAELVVAVAMAALLAPVFAACALLVTLCDGRPVLFRQSRMGRRARPFTLYKFRTMRPMASGPHFTAEDDVRITSLGRVLRRTKCDELPQLWNVIKGDMSLVGPRPEAIGYVDSTELRWQTVLAVRPGLTDPVTIALRNEEALLQQVHDNREDFYLHTLQPFKLRGYVLYLHHRTWRTDVRVLLDTVLTVLVPGRAPQPTIDDIKARGAIRDDLCSSQTAHGCGLARSGSRFRYASPTSGPHVSWRSSGARFARDVPPRLRGARPVPQAQLHHRLLAQARRPADSAA